MGGLTLGADPLASAVSLTSYLAAHAAPGLHRAQGAQGPRHRAVDRRAHGRWRTAPRSRSSRTWSPPAPPRSRRSSGREAEGLKVARRVRAGGPAGGRPRGGRGRRATSCPRSSPARTSSREGCTPAALGALCCGCAGVHERSAPRRRAGAVASGLRGRAAPTGRRWSATSRTAEIYDGLDTRMFAGTTFQTPGVPRGAGEAARHCSRRCRRSRCRAAAGRGRAPRRRGFHEFLFGAHVNDYRSSTTSTARTASGGWRS